MKGDSLGVADIIPVDIPVNMMISVAWFTAVHKPSSVPIFHSTTGSVNPFTWGEIGRFTSTEGSTYCIFLLFASEL